MHLANQISNIRSQFPALDLMENDLPTLYLDGPAGAQVPQRVVAAHVNYMVRTNANSGGAFRTSVASDALLDSALATISLGYCS